MGPAMQGCPVEAQRARFPRRHSKEEHRGSGRRGRPFCACSSRVSIGDSKERSLGIRAVCALTSGAEAVQRRQPATRSDFEQGAVAGGSAALGHSVEVAVGCLVQSREGVFTVRATDSGAKVVQRRESAASGNLEDRTALVRSATTSCSVKVSIGGLDQRSLGA